MRPPLRVCWMRKDGYTTKQLFSWSEGRFQRDLNLHIERVSPSLLAWASTFCKNPRLTTPSSSGSLVAYGAWKYRYRVTLELQACRRTRTHHVASRRRRLRRQRTRASSFLVMASQRRRRARAQTLRVTIRPRARVLLDSPRMDPGSLVPGL
ncbi:uncharacterized protein M421DRAFT_193593 [Didymella exigua CBS 183.55]|uniref:Uncharacterized protein n=1 Tax=Didymella exigua CBS 183.55 TaxID=1150837 RepID=A0A6A5S0C1_9PLEO|nr:uncharacterized protein M421DRAFT_193593 [Didymella exigua CBS 183.55]KAF1933293.1 hypothetical protein M421DRAFT_193593 [Didymella exigua CBS 183.55]